MHAHSRFYIEWYPQGQVRSTPDDSDGNGDRKPKAPIQMHTTVAQTGRAAQGDGDAWLDQRKGNPSRPKQIEAYFVWV
jgi:hypothetical protein